MQEEEALCRGESTESWLQIWVWKSFPHTVITKAQVGNFLNTNFLIFQIKFACPSIHIDLQHSIWIFTHIVIKLLF